MNKVSAEDLMSRDVRYEKPEAGLTEENLATVVALAEVFVEQSDDVARLEAELKEAKKRFMATEREDLPGAMREAGLAEFTLENGRKIEVKSDLSTKIPEAYRAAAMRWLVDNNFGGIVKTFIAVEFGRGEREAAEKIAQVIAEAIDGDTRPVKIAEDVHHSTLKAFVKERKEKGEDFPDKLFGVHTYDKAKVS